MALIELHRIEGKPEWSGVKPAARNGWQKAAAATNGIVTIGNFFSLLGLISVPIGLLMIIQHEMYLSGAIILGLGRLCDVLDGTLADKTGTKSPLGEKIDAIFDKISVAGIVLGLGIGEVFPWEILFVLAIPHAVIAVIALAAYLIDRALHPSLAGKLSMGAAWMFLIVALWQTDIAEHAGEAGDPLSMPLFITAWVLLLSSFILGLIAAIGYIFEYLQSRNSTK